MLGRWERTPRGLTTSAVGTGSGSVNAGAGLTRGRVRHTLPPMAAYTIYTSNLQGVSTASPSRPSHHDPGSKVSLDGKTEVVSYVQGPTAR